MNHDAFLQAIYESPADDVPRFVYADWLEEQDDPRGELIRTQCFLAQMDSDAPGRAQLLRRQVELLGKHTRKWVGPLWKKNKGMRFHRGFLCLRDCTVAVADLASTSELDDLLAILETHSESPHLIEVMACLLQELVVRKSRLPAAPFIAKLAERLKTIRHPLGKLPLFLHDIELDVRDHGGRFAEDQPGFPLAGRNDALPLGSPFRQVTFHEVLDDRACGGLAEAVRDWENASNGRVEARIFRSNRALAPELLSSHFLRSLELSCLAETDAEQIQPRWIARSRAFRLLYFAAAFGGAYANGRGGAYGRLAAWRSVGGLVGAEPDESIEAVAARAERCAWIEFDAPAWFYNVAWDLALLVLRPVGLSLAVLAATDTD